MQCRLGAGLFAGGVVLHLLVMLLVDRLRPAQLAGPLLMIIIGVLTMFAQARDWTYRCPREVSPKRQAALHEIWTTTDNYAAFQRQQSRVR